MYVGTYINIFYVLKISLRSYYVDSVLYSISLSHSVYKTKTIEAVSDFIYGNIEPCKYLYLNKHHSSIKKISNNSTDSACFQQEYTKEYGERFISLTTFLSNSLLPNKYSEKCIIISTQKRFVS